MIMSCLGEPIYNNVVDITTGEFEIIGYTASNVTVDDCNSCALNELDTENIWMQCFECLPGFTLDMDTNICTSDCPHAE